MAMVVMHTEPEYRVVGFSDKLIDIPLSTRMRLDGVIKRISGLPFSYTDASLPLKEGLKWTDVYDTFVTYTDNEVNAGGHPAECLTNYAVKKGVDARMAVCAVTATNCTIADPANRNMLDLVGFDSSSAQVLSDFSAGKL